MDLDQDLIRPSRRRTLNYVRTGRVAANVCRVREDEHDTRPNLRSRERGRENAYARHVVLVEGILLICATYYMLYICCICVPVRTVILYDKLKYKIHYSTYIINNNTGYFLDTLLLDRGLNSSCVSVSQRITGLRYAPTEYVCVCVSSIWTMEK